MEGRLRLAIGDSWTGLDHLWRLSLRWHSPDCTQKRELLRSQKPLLFIDAMAAAADSHQVRLELLQAISKQESRFAPGVTSPAGAIGLMQLMPATAEEMAAEPLTEEMLKEPERNIGLGAAYLDQLIDLWNGDPFPASPVTTQDRGLWPPGPGLPPMRIPPSGWNGFPIRKPATTPKK